MGIRLVLLAFAASGCDVVFGVSAPSETDAGIDAPPLVEYCFHDSFDTIDLETWSFDDDTVPPAVTVAANASAQLEITFAQSSPVNAYNGLSSRQLFDLRDAFFQVEIVQAPTGSGVEAYLSMSHGTEYYLLDIAGGMLFGEVKTDGQAVDSLNIPYDPSRHRYVQIVHQRDTDRVQFRASIDARSWVLIREVGVRIPLDAVEISIAGGTYRSVTPPPAIFDNLRVGRTSCTE